MAPFFYLISHFVEMQNSNENSQQTDIGMRFLSPGDAFLQFSLTH